MSCTLRAVEGIFVMCFTLKGFPGGSDGKESTCNAGNPGSIPGPGRSSAEGNGYPVFLPGEFHGQRSQVGYSPWSLRELDMTEQLTLSSSHWKWSPQNQCHFDGYWENTSVILISWRYFDFSRVNRPRLVGLLTFLIFFVWKKTCMYIFQEVLEFFIIKMKHFSEETLRFFFFKSRWLRGFR